MARTKQTARKDPRRHSDIGEKTIPMSQSPREVEEDEHEEGDEEFYSDEYSSEPNEKVGKVPRKVLPYPQLMMALGGDGPGNWGTEVRARWTF